MITTGAPRVHISKPVRRFLLPSRQGIMSKCHLWLHIGSVSYGISLPVSWFLQTPTMGSSMLWGISLTDCLWLFPRHGSRTGLEWSFLIIKIPPDQLCCAYVQGWHRPNEWDVCHGTKSWGGSSGYWSQLPSFLWVDFIPSVETPQVCGIVRPGFWCRTV